MDDFGFAFLKTNFSPAIMARRKLSFFHGVTAATIRTSSILLGQSRELSYCSKILPIDRGNITHFLSEDFLLSPRGMLHDPKAQGLVIVQVNDRDRVAMLQT